MAILSPTKIGQLFPVDSKPSRLLAFQLPHRGKPVGAVREIDGVSPFRISGPYLGRIRRAKILRYLELAEMYASAAKSEVACHGTAAPILGGNVKVGELEWSKSPSLPQRDHFITVRAACLQSILGDTPALRAFGSHLLLEYLDNNIPIDFLRKHYSLCRRTRFLLPGRPAQHCRND
jgi:hypothetical protein